jgi:hypothetical protein
MADIAVDGGPDCMIIIDCSGSRSVNAQEVHESSRAVTFCAVIRNFRGDIFIPMSKGLGSPVRMAGFLPEAIGFDLFHQGSDIKVAVRRDQDKTGDKEYKQNA